MDNYLSNGARKSTNVFDEEIDDEEFLRHPRAGNAGYALPNQNNRPVSQHMTGQQRLIFELEVGLAHQQKWQSRFESCIPCI